MKPRLLDLFCGAGGCTKGYQEAGFYVVGVDINPQPNYCGDEFFQADALEFPLDGFVAIHASPPCQAYSITRNAHGRPHPELIEPVRGLLQATGVPYVIENVEGSPLAEPIRICGLSLGLNVKRHRLFECSFPAMGVPCGDHRGNWLGVYGGTPKRRRLPGQAKRGHASADLGREAMGIDWMTRDELSQAIPPAYTEFIGQYLMAEVMRRREPSLAKA